MDRARLAASDVSDSAIELENCFAVRLILEFKIGPKRFRRLTTAHPIPSHPVHSSRKRPACQRLFENQQPGWLNGWLAGDLTWWRGLWMRGRREILGYGTRLRTVGEGRKSERPRKHSSYYTRVILSVCLMAAPTGKKSVIRPLGSYSLGGEPSERKSAPVSPTTSSVRAHAHRIVGARSSQLPESVSMEPSPLTIMTAHMLGGFICSLVGSYGSICTSFLFTLRMLHSYKILPLRPRTASEFVEHVRANFAQESELAAAEANETRALRAALFRHPCSSFSSTSEE
ncbi:hypothetical protein MPTK1_4g15550 [Marchantia polymorpha subsp. ruderalis]|uniref:Uncharacterized protein n=2 Tax=Marchantia polymorpha TaxID=3197 RepID=A0AAF6BA84_MARPO|nr:hypothetical protein MARPO_0054s0020 [Marchantia polymorpha]BBN08918.1 hypothetical protein Mp_4g15550 [Marchantia polymorpha subsp. ruderalis]|eukprot:PTQ37904.1 hypothetical protein MARPO_0054s0020 [Marchantia polymorpha]